MSERSEGEGVASGSTQRGQDVLGRANAAAALTRAVGTDHTTARRVALGMQCVECSEPFTGAHGTPTACSYCWPKLPLEERKVMNRATLGEATKEHFRTENRAKRERKND